MTEIKLSDVNDEEINNWFLNTPVDEIKQFIRLLDQEEFKLLFEKLKIIDQQINSELDIADEGSEESLDEETIDELSNDSVRLDGAMGAFQEEFKRRFPKEAGLSRDGLKSIELGFK